jgi:predicted HicB family RNase H-like nuclease
MHLSLVSSIPPAPAEFLPEPLDLPRQPWRPGELCQIVDVELPTDLRARLDGAAADQCLPVAVVVLAAVEAERAIATICTTTDWTHARVVGALDAAASTTPERGIDPAPARRLRAYANAIFAGLHPPTVPTPTELAIRVPQSLAAAWALAAASETSSLGEWIVRTLEGAELNHTRWEAASAYAGQPLASWAALTALAAD